MTRSIKPNVKVKRVYDVPARSDGRRVLVDRIWPRGLSKQSAKLDAWIKELAPSAELRQWFGHDPVKWSAFKRKYFRELDQHSDVLEQLFETFPRRTTTLLFAAADLEHNNAVALKEYVEKQLSARPK